MAGASYLCDVAEPEMRSFDSMLWMMQQEEESMDAANLSNNAEQKPDFLEMLFAGDVKIVADTADGSLKAVNVTDAEEKADLKAKIDASPCMEYYQKYAANAGKTQRDVLISVLIRLNPFGIGGLRQ